MRGKTKVVWGLAVLLAAVMMVPVAAQEKKAEEAKKGGEPTKAKAEGEPAKAKAEGEPAKAKQQLAEIAKRCGVACEDYRLLADEIAKFEGKAG